MDARPTTADSKHHYPPKLLWSRSTSSPVVPRLNSVLSPTPPASATPLSPATLSKSPHSGQPHIDLIPILFPQQSSLYQAQLLQYNKLIAPSRGRGGGTGGLQTPPLPPILSTPTIHIGGNRSRSTSKVSNNKDSTRSKPGSQTCHGNRGLPNTTNKASCAVITGKESSASLSIPSPSNKMPQKPQARTTAAPSAPAPVTSNPNQNQKTQNTLPVRPTAASTSPATLASVAPPTHSNSVPSTPHQHARKFSFESREPSPTANHGHSPRSAYSETNGNLPSLRPLPLAVVDVNMRLYRSAQGDECLTV
ncbi:hypothetical protein PG997_009668 [Apiospora hydei]|uniref:Uncharacterized protein n=1 Tax=Apiospora hydei TaxID=1337664 RepID=A0ABR1VXV3_9PEZI